MFYGNTREIAKEFVVATHLGPSLGTGFRLQVEQSTVSISDSDSGVPPSFVNLVLSWLNHGLLAVLVASKTSVLCSAVLSS